MSRRVTDPSSTATATNFGVTATCITQLAVIRLRCSPARLPTTKSPVGIDHSTRRRMRSYSPTSTPSGKGPTGPAVPVMDQGANGSPLEPVGAVVDVDGTCPVSASIRWYAVSNNGAIRCRSCADRVRSEA